MKPQSAAASHSPEPWRNYAHEVLTDLMHSELPNLVTAQRARDQAEAFRDEIAALRAENARLRGALRGIFAQTAKHARQWGQIESAAAFARDPDTATAFANARAALAGGTP